MVKCPVCGKHDFPYVSSGEDCPVCGWANDGVQMRHPDWLGDNNFTLNEAREYYKIHGYSCPRGNYEE